eukprot:TRINITY_DN49401_c0_g1_i2.p1 TRINITY_DN49401_c0_g1~~TRINITY_DN49401_c0_g1_i2.p1  ORF type:complete len:111 (+),score=45.13 TRINITY_DN49401_c0_g1_i2:48-335(+)
MLSRVLRTGVRRGAQRQMSVRRFGGDVTDCTKNKFIEANAEFRNDLQESFDLRKMKNWLPVSIALVALPTAFYLWNRAETATLDTRAGRKPRDMM